MRVKGSTISQQLRSAVRDSNVSIYAISKACGIDQGTLSRFKDGKVGLSLKSVDLLAKHLRLTLVQK